MGFWDWLTGKSKRVEVVDTIWMNQEAKFQGLRRQIQNQLGDTPIILVVGHFSATLDRLKEDFAQDNVNQRIRLTPADILDGATHENVTKITLVQADALIPDEFPNPSADEATCLPIVVAERHLLRSHDDAIVNFANSLGRRCRLVFHVSLKDPLMQAFAGEWVGQMLSSLGMKESDSIQNAMVSRRIQAAQAVFAKRITEARNADSAEEWLQLNLPNAD